MNKDKVLEDEICDLKMKIRMQSGCIEELKADVEKYYLKYHGLNNTYKDKIIKDVIGIIKKQLKPYKIYWSEDGAYKEFIKNVIKAIEVKK